MRSVFACDAKMQEWYRARIRKMKLYKTTYYQRLGDWEFKELPRKPRHNQIQLKDVFRYDISRDTLVSVYHILEREIIRDYILSGQVVIHSLSK